MSQPTPHTAKLTKFDVAAQIDGKVSILISLDNGFGHSFAFSSVEAKLVAAALVRQADIAEAYQQKRN